MYQNLQLAFLEFLGFFNKVSMALLANYIELNNTAIFVVSSSEVLVFPELAHRGLCFILEDM